jgi:adenylate kinase
MRTFRELYEQQQMRIVMLGGPGSGKSTYTEYLIRHFRINHIYPGGMLRKEVENNTEIGKRVKEILAKGQFVPNDIVLDLIKKSVSESPNGYVLDGWPRYMQQVRDMEASNIGVDFAVFLDVSREEVLKRLLARGRADDTEEIINNRIDLYKRETGPVVEYFRDKQGFLEIKAQGDTAENIANNIIRRIEDEIK